MRCNNLQNTNTPHANLDDKILALNLLDGMDGDEALGLSEEQRW